MSELADLLTVNIERSWSKARQPLPGIHLLFSPLKRWLAGSHRSAFDVAHLSVYLERFVFRFNRRTSRQRGLVFLRLLKAAVAGPPVTYRDLVANPATTNAQVTPPGVQAWPRSLAQPPAFRPWRTPGLQDQNLRERLLGRPARRSFDLATQPIRKEYPCLLHWAP